MPASGVQSSCNLAFWSPNVCCSMSVFVHARWGFALRAKTNGLRFRLSIRSENALRQLDRALPLLSSSQGLGLDPKGRIEPCTRRPNHPLPVTVFFVGGACGTEGALDCCTDVRDAYKYATQSRSSLGPGQGALNAFHQSLLLHHFGFAENHFRKLFYVRLGCLADGVVLQRGGLRLDVTQPHS